MVSITVSNQTLRENRIKKYCEELKTAICAPSAVLTAIGIADKKNIPPEGQRAINFKQIIKDNFLREYNNFNDDYLYSWPRYGSELLSAYKALQKYSHTPYGALIFRQILRDNAIKGKEPFKIKLFDGSGAKGFTNFIRLPSGFPLKEVLITGDKIDTLAIIHHEFGHTRYYKDHKHNKEVDIYDERDAVIYMENPVRFYNKNEPRYAYYNDNDENPLTINIISKEVKAGKWAFDKNDPSKLVPI